MRHAETVARLLVMTAALVLAAGASRAAPAAPASCPRAGTSNVQGGILVTPAHAVAGRTGLIVVMIPGGGGDPGDHLGVARAAGHAGVGVLYPTRSGGIFWQLNKAQGTSDVDNVSATLDRVLAAGCFDPHALTVTGVSNGAGFAQRLACSLPGRFAVVAPVAAGYRALDPCPADERASFLDIHGTADTVVPYLGTAADGHAGSVPRNSARWAARDGCSARRHRSHPRRLVQETTWSGCASGLHVEALRLAGTNHGWPGSRGRRRPRNPSHLSAAPALLAFVREAGATR
jgi:poly(3-hydroxybutyrate) depolymerase